MSCTLIAIIRFPPGKSIANICLGLGLGLWLWSVPFYELQCNNLLLTMLFAAEGSTIILGWAFCDSCPDLFAELCIVNEDLDLWMNFFGWMFSFMTFCDVWVAIYKITSRLRRVFSFSRKLYGNNVRKWPTPPQACRGPVGIIRWPKQLCTADSNVVYFWRCTIKQKYNMKNYNHYWWALRHSILCVFIVL